ncbi:MAG: GGDEF domain-containing protein [Cellulosilyticaceae bacterium]
MLQKNNYYVSIYSFLVTALMLLICIGAYAHNKYSLTHTPTQLTSLDTWDFSSASTQPKKISLPFFLNYKNEDIYILKYTFNNSRNTIANPTITFLSNHMYIQVYLDEKEIYNSTPHVATTLSKSPGNQLHLIPLPQDYAGKTLTIKLHLLLENHIQYEIPKIGFGDRSSMVSYISFCSLPSFLIMIIVFFLGLQMLFFNLFFYHRTKQNALFHLGFFSIIFSLYSLSENPFIMLATDSTYLLYLFNFFIFALIPIPLLLFFKEKLSRKFNTYFNLLILLAILNFIIQFILHFSHLMDIREMVLFTHIVSLSTVILFIIAFLFTPSSDYPYKKTLGIQFIPMGIGAFLDFAFYMLPISSVSNTLFFQLGVFLFLILEMIDLGKYLFTLYTESLKMNFYRYVAYTDSLTGLLNRTAFDQELEEIENGMISFDCIWCVSIDLNNLKTTNDTLGHKAGDILIQTSASLFEKEFSPHGKVFRIGGDEFMALLYNLSEPDLEKHITHLKHRATLLEDTLEFPVSFAIGYACLSNNGCGSLACTLEVADTKMYENKNHIKSNL